MGPTDLFWNEGHLSALLSWRWTSWLMSQQVETRPDSPCRTAAPGCPLSSWGRGLPRAAVPGSGPLERLGLLQRGTSLGSVCKDCRLSVFTYSIKFPFQQLSLVLPLSGCIWSLNGLVTVCISPAESVRLHTPRHPEEERRRCVSSETAGFHCSCFEAQL